jgi:hypothetical protein
MHAAAKAAFATLESRMTALTTRKHAKNKKTETQTGRGTFDTELMIACSDAISRVVETNPAP